MSVPRRHVLQLLTYAAGSSVMLGRDGFAQNPAPRAQPEAAAEKVAGIGGLFFRAKDPHALAHWYLDHLGITLTPTTEGGSVWQQEAGPTAFTPFGETSNYPFEEPGKNWMVNFRVHHLDRMVAQLRASGIEVKVDPQTYSFGRFARLHDPEGNPVELWEPA